MTPTRQFMLVAIANKGIKQLKFIKPNDHVRLMSEDSATAYNKVLAKEGLEYIKMNNNAVTPEDLLIDKMFDNLFMVNNEG